MNNLSVEHINASAPYKVVCSSEFGYVEFATEYGVKYKVGFEPDDIITVQESYQLIIANVNNVPSPRDAKVRDTILLIVDDFFIQNNLTVIYVCESSDNKQKLRSRLFEYWFSTYRYKANYLMLNSSVVDEYGVTNYATLILRNDNAMLKDVVEEFTLTVQALQNKPE